MSPQTAEIDLQPLTTSSPIGGFSSGDADLDEFLRDDALRLQERLVTRVYLATRADAGEPLGYMAVLADLVELKSGEKRQLGLSGGPGDSRFIPAVKVGRLAVSADHQGQGVGQLLMGLAVDLALSLSHRVGCRLVTVDAYEQSVGFYEHLRFNRRKVQPASQQTVGMWFDIAGELPEWMQQRDR